MKSGGQIKLRRDSRKEECKERTKTIKEFKQEENDKESNEEKMVYRRNES